ncbi:MAG: pilus assembly PilX N-terminal domain-containing protein [Phycisphaerae bacterium]|nr:pilus assembly PilX N-terminal domain-containing protein [Phycisphaerae bacterium]
MAHLAKKHRAFVFSEWLTVGRPGLKAPGSKNSGMVLALTMIFLVVAVSLAGVLLSSGSMGLQQSVNQRESHQARLAAESGIGHITKLVRQISLNGDDDAYVSQVSEALNIAMVGTSVYTQGSTLYVPPVVVEGGEGGSFSARMSKSGDNFLLIVTGVSGGTSRALSMELAASTTTGSSVFENGFLLGGKLQLTGNAQFKGKNDPSEAQVFTNYDAGNESFKLTGNAKLEGDIHSANPDGYASLSGNVSVAGQLCSSSAIWDHIHFGAPSVELPRPDTSIFKPYATNTLSGPTSGGRTFTNIRIPANTNPTFSGNTTLNGVIYIESPNTVKFSGNLKITGVIVTDDPGPGKTGSNKLQFTGNTTAKGVEELPDEPQYAALRNLPGAAILAPGFEMKFTGNFGTVGGALAAEKFTFFGNAGGIVKGPVISYGSEPFSMTGNAYLTIDRSDYEEVPPGFTSGATVLSPLMNTYKEIRE